LLPTRYGLREILLALIVCGGGGAALALWVSPWAAIAPGVLLLFTFYFFRDPRRIPPGDERTIVSPADGKVVDIEEVDEPDVIGGKAVRVGIFLSIFNVHLNRAPLAGRVTYIKYQRGRFLAAFNENASADNESNTIGIETALKTPGGDSLRIKVKQIVGIIARRIVCAVRVEQTLARGERLGMIKFGSRTELYLPVGAAELAVGIGDTVRGGRTVIGTVVDASDRKDGEE
jgi:phosphatidylserine decarboxylase